MKDQQENTQKDFKGPFHSDVTFPEPPPSEKKENLKKEEELKQKNNSSSDDGCGNGY